MKRILYYVRVHVGILLTLLLVSKARGQGNALYFPSGITNDFVQIPPSPSLSLTSAFTLETWVAASFGNEYDYLLQKGSNGNQEYGLQITHGKTIKLLFTTSTGQQVHEVPDFVIPTDRWFHLAATYEKDANVLIYINGEQIYTAPASGEIQAGTEDLVLGGNGPKTTFAGKLDELRIWNVALTQAQIQTGMTQELVGDEDNLVAYYSFNDSTAATQVTDRTSNHNDGNLINMDPAISWPSSYALVRPTALPATEISTTGFKANWKAPTLGWVGKYYLEVSTNEQFTSYVYGPWDGTGSLSEVITDLTPNTTYYYRVSASRGDREVGAYSNTIAVTTAAKASQLIRFDDLTAVSYGDPDVTLQASASSGLPVSFSSSNLRVASIVNGKIVILGTGTSMITALQAGNTQFHAAPSVAHVLTVNKATQTITFDHLPVKTYGDAPFKLAAMASSGLAVSYKVVSGPATIAESTLTLTGSGVVVVEASQSGNLNYSPATTQSQRILVSFFRKLEKDEVVKAKGPSMGNAWGDFNNDGFEDLYVCNYAGYSNFLFKNNGNGSFTTVTEAVIEGDYADSFAATWGDYDNDGYLDLFVANHDGTNILYHNNSGASFTRITTGAIVTDSTEAWDASWVDYDNDANLDLFVAGNNGNFLYHNLGNKKFERVTSGAIVQDKISSFSCAWGDYNNDGYLDLFVANYGNQNNCLYKNLRNGKFEKILSGSLVNDGGQSRSASWGDYNNDGFLDLYVTNSGQTNFLYKNNGNGSFTRVLNDPLVNESNWSFSATWSDYDNDGYLDMFVTRSTDTDSVTLFRNNQNGTFSNVHDAGLFAASSSSWSCSANDFDRNGTPDIYVASRGFNPSHLFKNQFTKNNYVGVSLKGTRSNKAAIGARVEVKTGKQLQSKYVAANTGHANQNGLNVLFGLGNSQYADTIKVTWPSKTVQKLIHQPANQYYSIVECQPKHTSLSQSICKKDSALFGNRYFKESGTYSQSFLSSTGCDSTITLTLTVSPLYTTHKDSTICHSCSYFAGGQLQNKAGTYYDTLQTVQGCDSILITRLAVEEPVITAVPNGPATPNVAISPNPTDGLVFIQNLDLDYYQVVDARGKYLFQSKGYVVDLSGFENGLYVIVLVDKKGRIIRKKIIKQ